MAEKLTQKQRWEERNFILLSLIRLHSMINLDDTGVTALLSVSQKLRHIEEDGGTISDDLLLEQYMEAIQ